MSDLFADKADDWDTRPIPVQISEGVSAALRDAVPLSVDSIVLDFGAGTGLLCTKLAPHVGHIHAVDISAAMLEQLATKPELLGKATIHHRDIIDDPLPDPVDVVVSAMAMHHVSDTAALLAALHDHLRPGGYLALADLDAEDGSFHPPGVEGVFHHGFDRESLQGSLQDAGFTRVVFRTAVTVAKEDRQYPVFLVTATRS